MVTGGAGYVGAVVAAQLVEAGHDVAVLDDLSTGHADGIPDGATLVAGPFQDGGEALAGWRRSSPILETAPTRPTSSDGLDAVQAHASVDSSSTPPPAEDAGTYGREWATERGFGS